jgi:hypothetical protein
MVGPALGHAIVRGVVRTVAGVASCGIRGELVAAARVVGRGHAPTRRRLLPRLKPSSDEAKFSPGGEVVPKRVHVPSEVVREQRAVWWRSVRYSQACIIVVGESRCDHGPIVLCLTAVSHGVDI